MYCKNLVRAALVCLSLHGSALHALTALYDQPGHIAKECLTAHLVSLNIIMPLQEINTATLAALTSARENNKQEMEQLRLQRSIMEEQLQYTMQHLQSQKQPVDPAQLICLLVMQRAHILCSSFAVTEPELDQPVITPAQFAQAVTKHVESLVQELCTRWQARNIAYRDEKQITAGILADLTGLVIESTTRAATTLWVAHNFSLEQFEKMLSEHRALLCTMLTPLAETIDCIMKQQ